MIYDVLEISKIWVREVLKEGYLPFSHPEDSDVSAEFYCDQDVNNYDNYDFIDGPELDNWYYCVAFNVLDDEEEEEEKVNICHATSSETNPYTFLEVPESAVDGEGVNDHALHIEDGDIIPITDLNGDEVIDVDDCNYEEPETQCSDGVDNDGDELVDELDPGCWSDPDDPETYNPDDNDENQQPIITLTTTTVYLMVDDSFDALSYQTASDPEDGDITDDTVASSTVNTAIAGTYSVEYDVEDSEGLIDEEDPTCYRVDQEGGDPVYYPELDDEENQKPVINLIGSNVSFTVGGTY